MHQPTEKIRLKYSKILKERTERDQRESIIGFCIEEGDYLFGIAVCYYLYAIPYTGLI
jgi:hypothetical protein